VVRGTPSNVVRRTPSSNVVHGIPLNVVRGTPSSNGYGLLGTEATSPPRWWFLGRAKRVAKKVFTLIAFLFQFVNVVAC
jgi:hypothetical protein